MSATPGETTPAPGEKPSESKRILAGVLAIVLGALGVHKFVLGMTTPGIIMLVVTVVCSGLAPCLWFPAIGSFGMWLIGIIEGIIYLTKSDEEFRQIYEVGKKSWF